MINISEKYEPLFNIPDGVDTFFITGGRNSQKSFAVGTAVCNMTVNMGYNTIYSRFTSVSAQDTIIPEFVEKISMLGWDDMFDIQQNKIVCTAKDTKVSFKGLKAGSGNQTANLKGLKGFSCWVLDEAEEMWDIKMYRKMAYSIRGNTPASGKPNFKILIMNPQTKEHPFFKEFFEDRGVQPGFNGVRDNVCYIHTSYMDCLEFVDPKMLADWERLKKNDPKEYENIVLGGWLDRAEGVVYENWEYGEFEKSLPYVYGMDFGYSVDPTALVKVAVDDKRNKIYLKEEIYEPGLTTNDISLRLQRIVNKNLIIADSAEPRLIKELRNRGFNIRPAVKGPDSVRAGIKKMQEYKIIVDGVNLGKELNNYVWSDKKSDTPVDAYNHCLDGSRYALSFLKIKSKRVGVSIEN